MGYLTTITVYNDSCNDIPANPQEFADAVYEACNSNKTKHVGVKGGADMKCQRTRHADDKTIYVHAGNTVCEMNIYAEESQDLVANNPEFAKEMIDLMQFHTTQLKKLYKQLHKKR